MIRVRTEKPVRGRALAFGFLLAALVVAGLMLTGKPAHAADFVVTTTDDSGAGSLRQAILDANAASGADTIKVNIPKTDPGRDPATGVFTISPASALPDITDTVTIDGYSQPGTQKNTLAKGTNAKLLIELNGENAAGAAGGLSISPPSGKSAAGSVVRGLVINRFLNGIRIISQREVRVEGNFIGTDPSGTLDLGNTNTGVFYSGAASTIGGASPAARNLISGNATGIFLNRASGSAKVEGNLIGTQKDGTSALGNSGSGVSIGAIFGAPDPGRIVGGDTAAAANTIAFNAGDGVTVSGCDFVFNSGFFCGLGNSVLRNSIFSNRGLGINLLSAGSRSEGANGVTANDPGDVDDENDGPNLLQNFPVLTKAAKSKKKTAVEGTLNSTANTTFIVQFFSSPEADPSGNGEGQRFLGQKVVTTDARGDATFTATTPKVPAGQVVTATATNEGTGDTSEFSQALVAS